MLNNIFKQFANLKKWCKDFHFKVQSNTWKVKKLMSSNFSYHPSL